MTAFKPLALAAALVAGPAFLMAASPAMAQATSSNDMTAASAASGKVTGADRDFMTKAAAGGMAEVALGQLGQQKASSDAVKQFAAHMVDDHTKANDQLKSLAMSKGVMLPAGPTSAQKADMSKIESMSGASFDTAFMKQMVADHKKTIALFEKGAKAPDSDVKMFATKTLPTLKEHLQEAQKVAQDAMGKSKSAAAVGTPAVRG